VGNTSGRHSSRKHAFRHRRRPAAARIRSADIVRAAVIASARAVPPRRACVAALCWPALERFRSETEMVAECSVSRTRSPVKKWGVGTHRPSSSPMPIRAATCCARSVFVDPSSVRHSGNRSLADCQVATCRTGFEHGAASPAKAARPRRRVTMNHRLIGHHAKHSGRDRRVQYVPARCSPGPTRRVAVGGER